MTLEAELDLVGLDENEVERGSSVPAGWYHCAVDDVYADPRNPDTLVFRHKVLSGPHRNCTIFDRLFSPVTADNPDKARFARYRMALYARRLGLIDGEAFGSRVTIQWADAIGREVVLHVKERTYADKDTGERKTTCGVDFAGVFAPGDERIPEQYRKSFSASAQAPEKGVAGSSVTPPAAGGRRQLTEADFADF